MSSITRTSSLSRSPSVTGIGVSRAGFHGKEKAGPVVAAGRDRGARHDRSKPLRGAIVHQRPVHRDPEVPLNGLGPLWAAMTLDTRAARIDCPATLSDLAADEVFVRGLAGANSNVGLTLGEIKIVITRHQLDPQTGMPCLERIHQERLGQP